MSGIMAKMLELLKNPRINEITHIGATPAISTHTHSLNEVKIISLYYHGYKTFRYMHLCQEHPSSNNGIILDEGLSFELCRCRTSEIYLPQIQIS